MKKKKTPRALLSFTALLLGFAAAVPSALAAQSTGPQHLEFAGLRSIAHQGQFNAIASDSAGNLYLLLDQKDGVRLLKTDSTATRILDQALLGAAGDVGLAMVLDPSGNLYVTGTSLSGSLSATNGAAFPAPVGTTINSFVARFDASLNLKFLTFGGSSRSVVSAIAATSEAVFVTGLIYSADLPVTPSAILQAPASGSSQNGFVEKFSSTGTTLLYATYLTGQGGDTSPTSIAADASDNAYIGGFTSAPGFPTIAALIPRALAIQSGFLTKLTPAGDGLIFSTFLPGSGISSLIIDPSTTNLLLSGSIALGQFPITSVTGPLVDTTYQVLLRMPSDGSAVLSSTPIAPATQSSLTPGPNGVVWVDGTLSTPLLPLAAIGDIGTGFAVRVSPVGSSGETAVDRTARFGGLAAANPYNASLPLTLTSLTVDANGSAVLAGSVAPTASSSLLATQTFDLPLFNAPTAALPSSVHDAVLAPGTCSGSLCAGSAAYLARLTPSDGTSLALSIDASPNLILRNLGSAQATGLTLAATGFNFNTTCTATLAAGDECTIALSGTGPGSLQIIASTAATQTIALAAISQASTANPLAFSPHEIDFGVQTSTSPAFTRIITVTNLTQQTQTFTSAGPAGPVYGTTAAVNFAEASSDCPLAAGNTIKQLASGAICHITLGFTPSTDPTKDGPVLINWTVGTGSVLLTGFQQAASLSLSATEIDFGTQFFGGLHSARFLYLSNNSAATIAHLPVALPAHSPFTLTDGCPAQLQPHTVCQLQLGYLSPIATSTDSTTLTLDLGLSVLVTGTTIPPPGVIGSGSAPTLSVTPSVITFPNAVLVSGVSNSTQTVTIQNTGASAFPLALALTGDFTNQSNCGTTLAAGASCSAVLTFAPAQPGSRTGLLGITAGSASPVYVNLSGTATAILPPNNGTLDFGNVPVGQPSAQWYKVSQSISTLTASTPNPAFTVILVEDIGYGHGTPAASSFLPATTGSCINCWLGIQFTPSAAGAANTILSLASAPAGNPYTVSLTGNGLSAAGLVLTPATQDFGSVTVNSSSAPIAFILTNLSATSITLNIPTVSGDFSLPTGTGLCVTSLNPNASCTLNVLFAPIATGPRTGTLTLATSAGSATSALTGFGAPDPGIAFNPSALVFSNVAGPTATVQTVTVTNTGSSSAQVGAPANANTAFAVATTCTTLAPAATCSLTVTYTPTSATISDTIQLPITVIAGGNAVLTTYAIPLSGAYTTSNAGLQIIPGTSDYGPAAVNALAGTRDFTLNNLTSKSLNLKLDLPRQFVLAGTPCATIAPNASCTFSATFLPLTNGETPGTLFATGTPTDNSAAVTGLSYLKGYGNGVNSLTITGSIAPGRVISFGQVPSGQSTQQTLTLTNTSSPTVSTTTSTITVHRVTSQWPFLSTTTCGTTLAIAQSCTVTITYTPLNQVATGSAPTVPTTDGGTLTIESDAISGPDQFTLTGTAAALAVAAPSNSALSPGFTASQNSLTFALTQTGFTSAPQPVTLTNIGNTVLHITGITASTDFTVSTSCASLVPGATCPLAVTFAPQIAAVSAGPRIGFVQIASDSTTPLEFLTLIGNAGPSTLVFSPTSLNFGAQLTTTTATLPITITNAGSVPATFKTIATTGDYTATGTCPAAGSSLAANATCIVQVAFTPTATGVRSGTLGIVSSASTSPLTALLTGLGVQSHLSISPTALTFASVTVGASSSLTFTLANTGTAAITGVAFKVTGDFAVTSPCSFTTLSAGVSCSVTVAFTPTIGGTRTGTLTVATSDPSSPNTIPLTGTGIALPTIGSFTMTVNGGATASQTVQQTFAASYTLSLTPINGFTGNIALTCAAVNASQYSTCSLPTSTLTLGSSTQTATVTINTLTSVANAHPGRTIHFRGMSSTTFCILAPSIFLFWRFRKQLASRPAALLLALLCTTLMMLTSGCGNGNSSTLRYTVPGTYQFAVTASSTTGTPVTQQVTLNMTITQ